MSHEQSGTTERGGQHFIESGVNKGQILEGPFLNAQSAESRAKIRSDEYTPPGLEMEFDARRPAPPSGFPQPAPFSGSGPSSWWRTPVKELVAPFFQGGGPATPLPKRTKGEAPAAGVTEPARGFDPVAAAGRGAQAGGQAWWDWRSGQLSEQRAAMEEDRARLKTFMDTGEMPPGFGSRLAEEAGGAVDLTMPGGAVAGIARKAGEALEGAVKGAKRGPKELPMGRLSDVRAQQKMIELYNLGVSKGGDLWYHGMGDTIRRIAGDEADIYAGIIAALSPRSAAGSLSEKTGKIHMGSNLYVADLVWQAYKRGGLEEVQRITGPMTTKVDGKTVPSELAQYLESIGETGIGAMGSKVENIIKAIKRERLGGDDALKIQNFKEALLGNKDAVVLDTWMKKIFYPKPRVFNWEKLRFEELPAAGHGAFSRPQYEATTQFIKDFAIEMSTKEKTVHPADVQAALWVAQKYIDEGEGALSGSRPFQESLALVFKHHKRSLEHFDEATRANIAKYLAVAMMTLGGAGVYGGQAEAAPTTTEPVTPRAPVPKEAL